ncbi:MAG: ubiquinone biosynthesis accessory factor UbiJ [Gammaproteobacteria bacterium]
MRIDDTLLRPLETVLNRQIRASTPARDLCRRLDGKALGIEVTVPPCELLLIAEADGVVVTGKRVAVPDAVLRGSPFALASLARPNGVDLMRSRTVTIDGDATVAEEFQRLLEHARPDFEEELSHLIGDVAAHQLGNLARGAFDWGRHALETLRLNTREFLQEESRDLPSGEEAEAFLSGVDRLAADVDRAEARLKRLENTARGRQTEDEGSGTPGPHV